MTTIELKGSMTLMSDQRTWIKRQKCILENRNAVVE